MEEEEVEEEEEKMILTKVGSIDMQQIFHVMSRLEAFADNFVAAATGVGLAIAGCGLVVVGAGRACTLACTQ